MNIELDGISLIKAGESESGRQMEVRSVSNISTSDSRSIVEHKVPGMEGSVFQNLGRAAVRISFDGAFQGKNAKSLLEAIRSKFKQGTALPFTSDVSGSADVTKVIIEDLKIQDVAGIQGKYSYSIILREYKEPPPEPTTPPSQDDQAEEWAEKKAEEIADSINVVAGRVLDPDGNPKKGAGVLLKSDDGEYNAETDEEGKYRFENMPPGKYMITVNAEGYEGLERELTVGKKEKEGT
ncbi:hypothetical protein CUJ83_04850 [Methanocella sp. CWC-04]|uniref:Carboxypeptidase regulatory-like domain-containing protein n=1 Tax=Methanooceanicella nereidis TaxID=2052831 RepID=A0AAP2W6P3_9EURY|nr:carboxypeptidase regulatory-like domain-containing protein [Methanocella sp. CWC-04]MCD1294326.1 hypothetical protein [Methanocella sp. CWC-04]